MYRSENSSISFDVHKSLLNSDTTVVFLPLYKSISNSIQRKQKSKTKSASLNIAEPAKSKPKTETKKAKEKSPAEKKVDKATTLVEQAHEKKQIKKQTKKVLAKNKEKENKVEIQKKEALKVEPRQTVEKIIEKNEIKEELEQKITSTAAQQAEDIDDANVRYVGRDDLDALQMQEYISQELVNHWQPPVGVPKDRVCELKILINWQGKATDIKILKPSGVLVYDMSTRSAVLAMNFPKWLWGKEFTINFKQ
jgi:outer membrane biosynthesis protein TonB